MTKMLKKASDFKVLSKIALSGGLLLIMVVAPLLWGFLPRGYAVLNENAEIKANPIFTVFMRMATSFVLTLVAFGVVWLSFGVLRKRSKIGFSQIRGKTWALIKERLPWLLLLSVSCAGLNSAIRIAAVSCSRSFIAKKRDGMCAYFST